MFGLTCPKCGNMKTVVVDARPFAAGIRRRRQCSRCKSRFTTFECGNDLMQRLMKRGFDTGLKLSQKGGKEKRENHDDGLSV